MPPAKQHNTWAQAAGKGLSSIGNGSTNSSNPDMESDQENSGSSGTKVMRMEDNVNESQIAAAFSEGWGQRGVNQDTSWDVPSSPQCSPKEGSTWNSSTSTGTEIWENNIRHHNKGGVTKPPTQVRESWTHTPTTHLGGTWGEYEDEWSGDPPWMGDHPQASGTSRGGNSGGEESNASAVWGANPVEKNWGAPPPGAPMNPSSWGAGEPQDNSPDNGASWTDHSHKPNRSFGNWSPVTGGGANKKQMPPSGWEETAPPPLQQQQVSCPQSGGNFDDGTAVWGNPVHQGKVSNWKDMPPNNKQMPNCMPPGPGNMCQNLSGPHGSGPGMIRLPQQQNMNKNDGSWMKNQALGRGGLSWTDGPNNHRDPSVNNRRIWEDIHNNPMQDNKGVVPGTPNTPNSAFGNWGEQNHPMGNYYGAKSKGSNSWADGQVDTSSWGGPMKQGGKPLSKDLIWASKQFRLLMEMNFKKDDIENALRRNNMNIEEALSELHASSNKDSSMLEMEGINALNMNQPRMHHGTVSDDMNFSEHSMDNSMPPTNIYGSNNFPSMNMFSSGLNFAQSCKNQVCLPQNTLNSQAGRMAQQNFPSTAQLRHLVQQIQMAVQAGHLNPQILNQPLAPQTLQLLYQLLQQIRYLHQLQQQQLYFTQLSSKPGSPPLQLSVQITQAKQHIVNLQNQIAAQQAIFLKQQQVLLPVQHPSLQTPQPSTFDVVKSNIDTINGLNSEFRDLAVKDPTALQQPHSRLTQWKRTSYDKEDNVADSSNGCSRGESSCEFSRAPGSITKSSSASNLSTPTNHHQQHSSSNLQTLSENSWPDMSRSQSDTWSSDPSNDPSSIRNNDSMGPPPPPLNDNINNKPPQQHTSASISDSKDAASSNPSTASSSSSQSSAYNLNDLVPEFEPGKPWKGTSRINKNFEDDPHVTPGSIAKSPLSLNSIKDSELFSWNTKPNAIVGGMSSTAPSLTSSTWTFSPPPSAAPNSIPAAKPVNSRSWSSRPSEQERIPWKGPSIPKTRGPPPGLSGQSKPITDNWASNESNNQGWTSNSGWEKQTSSNFLVLKNLTPQIDGSTLKTLCLQHGPLQLFHLLLNHGIALVRYSTREETEKARGALNNCVLSNTTILVDIPTELEVKQYLQLASGQMAGNVTWSSGNSGSGVTTSGDASGYSYPITTGGNANAGGGNGVSKLGSGVDSSNWNTSGGLSSSLWSYSGSGGGNGLWAMQSASGEHDPCIPSSLNSFLPGDLLGGGESI